MRQLKCKFVFKGGAADLLTKDVEDYLIKEFVDRREIFINMVNPMYEKWNQEFDSMHPDKDGYSVEYLNFIYEKHREPLKIANDRDIFLNEVKLTSDFNGGGEIYGYIEKLKVCLYLTLCE